MSPHLFDELRIFGELEILHAVLLRNASVPSSCDLSAILNGGTFLQFHLNWNKVTIALGSFGRYMGRKAGVAMNLNSGTEERTQSADMQGGRAYDPS